MSNKTVDILAILVSLIIHAIFLFTLSTTLTPPPPPPPPPARDNIKVKLVESAPLNYVQQDTTTVDEYGKKVYKRDEKMCAGLDNTYLGIGIMIQPGSDTVIAAPPQYPAYKAGMRIGDYIVNPWGVVIVDGYLDYDVRRSTEILKFHVKVENICYKTPK